MINREMSLEEAMRIIKNYCNKHPTCDGCSRRIKHEGCYFRRRSPREWKIPEVFESEGVNDIRR